MFKSCLDKQAAIKALFSVCESLDEKYQKIIDLGRQQAKLNTRYKIPENIVPGCQSIMHLHSYCENGLIYFEAESEALISSGLAAILLLVYSGETPETVLKCPPEYLEELGIQASLTPSRANGMYSIHLRMKQDALKSIVNRSKDISL